MTIAKWTFVLPTASNVASKKFNRRPDASQPSIAHANQIENLRRTRDLLLPRLLSGQVNE